MTRVWITGGKGFIGRHLASYSSAQSATVFGLGHGLWPVSEASKWGFSGWINGTIDHPNLTQLMRVSGLPDVIFHLAGGSSVGASLENTYEDFCRTVDCSARLLEWVKTHAPATRVVCVSSAAVYGANHTGLIAEDASTSPFSPYGAHKFMMETLCRSYAENFGLAISVVRLFSVYGEGLQKQLLWDTCCKLSERDNSPLVLGGTGGELRDWLHVSDAADLLWKIQATVSQDYRVINGGTGIGTSILDISRLLSKSWGSERTIRFSGKARPGDPFSLVADCRYAKSLGFQPGMPLDEGIEKFVAWFKGEQ